MANIEIITYPSALDSIHLPAASIFTNMKAEIIEAAKTAVSNIPITNLIDTEILSRNLRTFLSNLQPVLDETASLPGSFKVNEIELSLAISAEGGIKLIGEFSAGFQTGITLKLSRGS